MPPRGRRRSRPPGHTPVRSRGPRRVQGPHGLEVAVGVRQVVLARSAPRPTGRRRSRARRRRPATRDGSASRGLERDDDQLGLRHVAVEVGEREGRVGQPSSSAHRGCAASKNRCCWKPRTGGPARPWRRTRPRWPMTARAASACAAGAAPGAGALAHHGVDRGRPGLGLGHGVAHGLVDRRVETDAAVAQPEHVEDRLHVGQVVAPVPLASRCGAGNPCWLSHMRSVGAGTPVRSASASIVSERSGGSTFIIS